MNKLFKEMTSNYSQIDLNGAQQKLIETLLYFDKFCSKYSIEYFVFYGTLLGAYREGDIIKWDDDIDVVVKEEDYNKLLAVSNRMEQPYSLLNISNNASCEVMYSRIINKNLLYFKDKCKISKNVNHYAYIDIFVMKKSPLDKRKVDLFLKRNRFNYFVLKYKYNFYQPSIFSKIIKPILRLILKPFSFIKIHDSIAKSYAKYIGNNTSKTDYIIPANNKKSFKTLFPVSSFEIGNSLSIRNHVFPVPNNVEFILKCLYGNDYMTPLPENLREPKKLFYAKED